MNTEEVVKDLYKYIYNNTNMYRIHKCNYNYVFNIDHIIRYLNTKDMLIIDNSTKEDFLNDKFA